MTTWEQRKEPRLNVRFAATIRWTAATGEDVVEESHTFSISNSGAGLITKNPLLVNQVALVTIDVGGPAGSSWAKVRWVFEQDDEFKVGVSFTGEDALIG